MSEQPTIAPRLAHPIEAYVACRAMGYRVPPKERKYLRHGGLINKAGTLTDKGERLLKRLKYLRKFKRVEEKPVEQPKEAAA